MGGQSFVLKIVMDINMGHELATKQSSNGIICLTFRPNWFLKF